MNETSHNLKIILKWIIKKYERKKSQFEDNIKMDNKEITI
jgi:hypothetical protein